MPKTEITKLAEKKLTEIALETGNFVDTAKVIDEMERISKRRWLDKGGRMERILKRRCLGEEGEKVMSEKKAMTRAEKLDALTCRLEVLKDYRSEPIAKCENCAYIDFCFDMTKFFTEMKAEKYV